MEVTFTSLASGCFEAAPAARTTVQSPLKWRDDDPGWKLDYCNIERLSEEELTAKRAEFNRAKAQAKEIRLAR